MDWHITPTAEQAAADLQEELRQREQQRSIASRKSSRSFGGSTSALGSTSGVDHNRRTSTSSGGTTSGPIVGSNGGGGGGGGAFRYSSVSSRGSSSGTGSSSNIRHGPDQAGGGSVLGLGIAEEDHIPITPVNGHLRVPKPWTSAQMRGLTSSGAEVQRPSPAMRISLGQVSWNEIWSGRREAVQSPRLPRPRILSSFNPTHGYFITRSRSGGLDGSEGGHMKKLTFGWKRGWEMRDVSGAVKQAVCETEDCKMEDDGSNSMETILAKVVDEIFTTWGAQRKGSAGSSAIESPSISFAPPRTPLVGSSAYTAPFQIGSDGLPEPTFISLKTNHAFSKSTIYAIHPPPRLPQNQHYSTLNNSGQIEPRRYSDPASTAPSISSRATPAVTWKVPYNIHSPASVHLYYHHHRLHHYNPHHSPRHHHHQHHLHHHHHRHSYDGATAAREEDRNSIHVYTNSNDVRSQVFDLDGARYTWEFKVRPAIQIIINSDPTTVTLSHPPSSSLEYAESPSTPLSPLTKPELKPHNQPQPQLQLPLPSSRPLRIPIPFRGRLSRQNSSTSTTTTTNPPNTASPLPQPSTSTPPKPTLIKFLPKLLVLEKVVEGCKYIVGEYYFLKRVKDTPHPVSTSNSTNTIQSPPVPTHRGGRNDQAGVLIIDSRGVIPQLAVGTLMVALKRERQRKIVGLGGLIGGKKLSGNGAGPFSSGEGNWSGDETEESFCDDDDGDGGGEGGSGGSGGGGGGGGGVGRRSGIYNQPGAGEEHKDKEEVKDNGNGNGNKIDDEDEDRDHEHAAREWYKCEDSEGHG